MKNDVGLLMASKKNANKGDLSSLCHKKTSNRLKTDKYMTAILCSESEQWIQSVGIAVIYIFVSFQTVFFL